MKSRLIPFTLGFVVMSFADGHLCQLTADDRRDCSYAADLDLAIRACTKIIDGESKGIPFIAYSRRGSLFERKEMWDSAISDYTESIKLDPKIPYGYASRAEIYKRKNQWEKAIADYDQAIALGNRETDKLLRKSLYTLYEGRGGVYAAMGEQQLAERDFRKARELTPAFNRPPAQKSPAKRRAKRCSYQQKCTRVRYPYTVNTPTTSCYPDLNGGTHCNTHTATSTHYGYRQQCRKVRVCN